MRGRPPLFRSGLTTAALDFVDLQKAESLGAVIDKGGCSPGSTRTTPPVNVTLGWFASGDLDAKLVRTPFSTMATRFSRDGGIDQHLFRHAKAFRPPRAAALNGDGPILMPARPGASLTGSRDGRQDSRLEILRRRSR